MLQLESSVKSASASTCNSVESGMQNAKGIKVSDHPEVPPVLVEDVLREFFKRATKKEGQRAFAKRTRINRANLNQAILGGDRERNITYDYIDKLAVADKVPLAVILKRIADVSWEMESANLPADRRGVIVNPGVMLDADTAAEMASEASRKKTKKTQVEGHRHPLTSSDAPAPRRG